MTKTLSDINQYGNLTLIAKQLVDGFISGLHKSPYHGFSVEFAGHKLYNFGESTRHIDWKLYSRTDRLYTKQYVFSKKNALLRRFQLMRLFWRRFQIT